MTQEGGTASLSRKGYLWIETCLVVLVCVVPPIFISEADVLGLGGPAQPTAFVYHAWRHLVENTGEIALVLFLIWRSNDSFSKFGFKRYHIGKDLLGGILILVIQWVIPVLTWLILWAALPRQYYHAISHSFSPPGFESPAGTPQYVLLAVYCAASGFAQELVMRAYLIVRFEELVDSTMAAYLLSTVLFVLYHGYQGGRAIIGISEFGLLFGLIFCRFRRLAPLAIAHALSNFLVIGNFL